jgi:O-succinylbenzoic acid--CoA ligase
MSGAPDVLALRDPHWRESEVGAAKDALRGTGASNSHRIDDNTAGWLLVPTGGTSGRVRFARHDESTLGAAVDGFTRHFGLTRVNALGTLPTHHVSGLMARMRAAATGGDYLPADWKELEAGNLPALPARDDGWVISFVPTQLERLLRRPAAIDWLRSFRIIFLGGAPAWPDLLDRAAEARLPVSLSYGMTETAAMVTALRPADFARGERSSGTAVPHARVSIQPGGVIRVAGESVFRGYWPELRTERFHDTSDLGRLDAEGQLHVLGRADEVIITGGEKVDPREVEAVLRATGEFDDVVVLGRPHPEWGAEVVAAYPAGKSPDLAKVRATLEKSLAPYKRPKDYVAVKDWPRSAAGKINRAALVAVISRKIES